MAKKPSNHGKDWTAKDVGALKQLAKGNTPTRVMGIKLGRTPESVQSKRVARRDISEADQSEPLQSTLEVSSDTARS
jgi:hypothetical protein